MKEHHIIANKKQLDILDQGVDAWNKWREENPDVEIDLCGANLVLRKLDGIDFHKADLRGANLSGSLLRKVYINHANFDSANLSYANLSETSCNDVIFDRAELIQTRFCDTILDQVNFNNANLMGANLRRSELIEVNLAGTNLRGVDFNEANIITLFYDRKAMKGKYQGICLNNCCCDAMFKRDAQDQNYIDTLETRCNHWYSKMRFTLWRWIDYGRSMFRVGLIAFVLVMIFGSLYKYFPHMVDYGKHSITPFTPNNFSCSYIHYSRIW